MTERERQGEHGWVWQGGRGKEWVRKRKDCCLILQELAGGVG